MIIYDMIWLFGFPCPNISKAPYCRAPYGPFKVGTDDADVVHPFPVPRLRVHPNESWQRRSSNEMLSGLFGVYHCNILQLLLGFIMIYPIIEYHCYSCYLVLSLSLIDYPHVFLQVWDLGLSHSLKTEQKTATGCRWVDDVPMALPCWTLAARPLTKIQWLKLLEFDGFHMLKHHCHYYTYFCIQHLNSFVSFWNWTCSL